MIPFKIAHISDLHVSTYGDSFHKRQGLIKRSKLPLEPLVGHELIENENGWSLWRKTQKNSSSYRLLDENNYEHFPSKNFVLPQDAISYVTQLDERKAVHLAQKIPNAKELSRLLRETPFNTNLLFISAAHQILEQKPDVIIITGDLTDDGDGYELIEAVFKKYIEQGRLLVVPGNHDLYSFPLTSSARPILNKMGKKKRWDAFIKRLGLEVSNQGGWRMSYPQHKTIIVGLDSCVTGQPKLVLHSGQIGPQQLSFLEKVAQMPCWKSAQYRIVIFHHHLFPVSTGLIPKRLFEIGMKLSDSGIVAKTLKDIGTSFVLHGHRHISEHRQPAHCNFQVLSAPSVTLGCLSGDEPSFWMIELLDSSSVVRRAHINLLENKPVTF